MNPFDNDPSFSSHPYEGDVKLLDNIRSIRMTMQ